MDQDQAAETWTGRLTSQYDSYDHYERSQKHLI